MSHADDALPLQDPGENGVSRAAGRCCRDRVGGAFALLHLLILMLPLPASEVPIGHPDFTPSREQPVGWRGDGSGLTQGHWPGARPPKDWGWGGPDDVTDQQIPGLAWSTVMPNQTMASPIVVGDKVITMASPHSILAYSVEDGSLVWHNATDQLDLLLGETRATAMRREWSLVDAYFWKYDLRPGKKQKVPEKERVHLLETAFGKPESELREEVQSYGWPDPHGKDIHGSGWYHKRMDYKYDRLGLWQRGYSTMGLTEATPVSDGEWVWASYVANTVACYAVEDGEVRWMRHFGGRRTMPKEHSKEIEAQVGKNSGRWPASKFYPSPLLIGDVLVLQHGHYLRGLDADSGRTLWEFPYTKTYYGTGTPVRMVLDDTDLIVTARGWVVRVADGKVLTRAFHDLAKDRQLGGSSMFTNGDDIIVLSDSGTGGGKGRQKVMAFRLALDGETITAQKLWDVDGASNEGSGLIHDGWVYENDFADRGHKQRRINLESGAIDQVPSAPYGGKYGSVHVAGDVLIDWDGFDSASSFALRSGGSPRRAGKHYLGFQELYGDFKGRIDPLVKGFQKQILEARVQAREAGLIGWVDPTVRISGGAYGQHLWFKGGAVYLRTRTHLMKFGR